MRIDRKKARFTKNGSVDRTIRRLISSVPFEKTGLNVVKSGKSLSG